MYNRVILIGRLVRDPEYRSTPDGITLARMTIAVDRIRSRDTRERQTDFIDLVAWRQQAEFAINYLKKGRLIMAEGRLQVRDWLSPQGERRRAYEVVVDRLAALDRPREPVEVAEVEPLTEERASTPSRGPGAPAGTAVADVSDPFLSDEGFAEEEGFDYDPFAESPEE